MKNARALLALFLAGLATVYVDSAPARAADKVTLCHFPPGNPANFHTITVSPEAAEAHIRNHGDVLGECCALDSICEDGNACTANFCVDNACTSEPVDCDDGDPCTNDSCDPGVGCINEPVACEGGAACNSDTGACLPVGQCPCWAGSNPIEELKAAFQKDDPYSCVEPTSLTCNGTAIVLAGQGSGPNGASASFKLRLPEPVDDYSCPAGPGGGGSGTCSCPPPPITCLRTGVESVGLTVLFLEPTTCVEEFEAACAALQ